MGRMSEGIVFGGMFGTMMLILLITSRNSTHSSLFLFFLQPAQPIQETQIRST